MKTYQKSAASAKTETVSGVMAQELVPDNKCLSSQFSFSTFVIFLCL